MKKLVFYSILSATLLITGCSQKNPEVIAKPIDKKKEEVVEKVIPKKKKEEVSRKENGNYLMIDGKEVFVENVYFEFDKSDLTKEMKNVIKSNVKKLKNIENNALIIIEGNCDERGSDDYNFKLGYKRSLVVKNALVEYGIPKKSLFVLSYGENRPVCEESTEECWEKSRRSEYKLSVK